MRSSGTAAAVLACLLHVPAVSQAAARRPSGAFEPSENRGRRGTYRSKTSHEKYDYHVYVPKSYSEENPAGIQLFFHGQGSQRMSWSFGLWNKMLLERYNLIGVNMTYYRHSFGNDPEHAGDNTKDTEGKVDAAIEALRQTMADYKIVPGRGIVASFSGGGLVHGRLYARFAGGARRRVEGLPAWPFNHSAIYSSNFRTSVSASPAMTWSIAVGQGEWKMANLGGTALSRMGEILKLASRGGCPDVYLKVIKGKGHVIKAEEVAETAKVYARSDLAFAPFIYAPGYEEKELGKIVRSANRLELGKALKAARALMAKKTIPDDLRSRAEALRRRIEERTGKVVALWKELAGTDPALSYHYGKLFSRQLMGYPGASKIKKEIRGITKRNKRYARAVSMPAMFEKNLRRFFTGSGMLDARFVPFMQSVKGLAGERSQAGSMAADFLLLQ